MASIPGFRARLPGLGVVMLALTSLPLNAQWRQLSTGTTASLRGLSVVNSRVVWASGTGGQIVRTVDGGATWRVDTIPGGTDLDLRSIYATSDRVAHVASTSGRIFRTTDGGRTWRMTWKAADTTVFLDAITFSDERNGVALGDPIGGRFLIVVTDDAGDTWREAPFQLRPATQEGEAAFAASGTSIVTDTGGGLWIGSGGSVSRLFYSPRRGMGWITYDSPFQQGSSSQGIFSLAREGSRIYAVGGDYLRDSSATSNERVFDSATRSWLEAASTPPRGYRSGVAVARAGSNVVLIAVGPGGTDLSSDGGRTWTAFDPTGFHAVRATPDGVFYASGSGGRAAVFDARAPR